MTRRMISFPLFLLSFLVQTEFIIADNAEICVEGYLSDTFCLDMGVFLDKPNVSSLMYPEQHTALCLLDPPQCQASYEILKPPEVAGENYTRWYTLDEQGRQLLTTYATMVGKGCSKCVGTIEEGITASVRGFLSPVQNASSTGPPILNVTYLGSDPCNSTTVPPSLNASAGESTTLAPSGSTEEICAQGYLSDTFCLDMGVFLDKPNVSSLMYPEQHTALCLLDPPQCQASYEILKAPEGTGENYTRWYTLDEKGRQLLTTYATSVGKGCSKCVGTIEEGITATVRGFLSPVQNASSTGPPILNVTYLGSDPCSSTPSAPIPASVPTPAANPLPTPAANPLPTPATPTASKPTSSTRRTPYTMSWEYVNYFVVIVVTSMFM